MHNHAEKIRGCKGCSDEYRTTEVQLARAIQALEADPERCVTEAVYAERMAHCRSCSKLLDGVTCGVCGCLVPVAAKLRARSCPFPGDSRWLSVQ